MTDINDAIRAAHAKEIHPANELVEWHANQLNELPGFEDDLHLIAPEENMFARIMYALPDGQCDSEADYMMPLPLSEESMLAAANISAHDGVHAVACYDVLPDGNNAIYPGVVFVGGKIAAP